MATKKKPECGVCGLPATPGASVVLDGKRVALCAAHFIDKTTRAQARRKDLTKR